MDFECIIITLGFFAFCGGFIDSAVGGGGLIQLPALLHAMPNHSLATLFGTNKVAALAGNISSIFTYARKIKIVWIILLPMAASAVVFSYLGAFFTAIIARELMEYVVFFILVFMAIYTFIKKDLGQTQSTIKHTTRNILLGIVLGGLIGFYDGAFGPGSGSILLFVFVRFFGFDFLNASASAKLVNLGTFSSALVFFIPNGNVLWATAGVIALFNIAGAIAGTFLSLRYGSGLIRIFFLALLVFLISRMGISIFL